jgi:hypothetical protein
MQDDGTRRGSKIVKVAVLVLFVGIVAMLVWASDRITLQGERTVYTVLCDHGTWDGNACSGTLAPDKRYAFRASKVRSEVLYWVRGSTAPTGHFADCKVVDRDNWTCKAAAGVAPATIAFEMAGGKPARGDESAALPFHAVPKWKWWLMDAGFRIFREAGD